MAGIGIFSPVVKVNGADLPAVWTNALTGMHVDRAFGLIGRARIRFTDADFALSSADLFKVGADVSLGVNDGQGADSVLMAGAVTGLEVAQHGTAHPELVVTVDDHGYRLTRGAHRETYMQVDAAAVMTKVAQRNGLTAKVSVPGDVQEYLMQDGTDLAFVDTLARRSGVVWWVDDKTLYANKPENTTADVKLVVQDLLDFSIRGSGLHPTEVTVNGWDRKQLTNITDRVNAVTGYPDPGNLMNGFRTGKALSDAPVGLSHLHPQTGTDAKTLADSLYADSQDGAVVATGTCLADPRLKPGVLLEIANAGKAGGKYVVSGVEHTFDSSGLYTRFTAGLHRPARLVDTLGPAEPDPSFTVPGLIVAVVTNIDDPDKLGRVKVKYIGVKEEDLESPWARVVSLGGGPARGTVFQPEVHDEVLVGFERGDTRRPVVIGGLFSLPHGLPSSGSGVNADTKRVDYRRITSRANHLIEFGDSDKPSEQHILLKTGSGKHKVQLGEQAFLIDVAAETPLTIQTPNAKFAISGTGDVTIEGKTVTIKSTAGPVKIDSATEVQATAKTKMSLSANLALEAKAEGTTEVSATGPVSLKGAIVKIN